MGSMGSSVVLAIIDGAVGVLLLLVVYLAPAIVAFARRHRRRWAILTFNVVLGWTGLGWIGALVWSLSRSARRAPTIPGHPDPVEPEPKTPLPDPRPPPWI